MRIIPKVTKAFLRPKEFITEGVFVVDLACSIELNHSRSIAARSNEQCCVHPSWCDSETVNHVTSKHVWLVCLRCVVCGWWFERFSRWFFCCFECWDCCHFLYSCIPFYPATYELPSSTEHCTLWSSKLMNFTAYVAKCSCAFCSQQLCFHLKAAVTKKNRDSRGWVEIGINYVDMQMIRLSRHLIS